MPGQPDRRPATSSIANRGTVSACGIPDQDGDRIRADDHGGGSGRADDTAGRYPAGSKATVDEDPDSPDAAVLMRRYGSTQVSPFGGIGAPFGVVGLGVLGFIGVMLRRTTRAGSGYPQPAFTTAPDRRRSGTGRRARNHGRDTAP